MSYTPSPKEAQVTQEDLRALFDFDPETGVFTHRTAPNNRIKVGDRAGHFSVAVGYYVIGVKRKVYQAHRLAWLYVHGEFPPGFIDHINHDRADNRIENLRVATRSQNGMNQRMHRDNRTGFKGVTMRRNKFVAQIKCAGRVKHIGCFASPEEAAAAYQQFAAEKWGDFAVGSAK